MNRGPVISLVACIALPLSAAVAQPDSVSSAQQAPKWEFSLGADPTQLDFRTRDPGIELRGVATLTRSWQNAGSRFSRQLSLMAGADAPRSMTNCYGCWARVTKQYASLTGGVAADLLHAWRFTPYLHTGAGVYYTRLSGSLSTFDGRPSIRPPRNDFSLGINGGLGVNARLFSHEFFIDETLHAFDVHTIDRGVYPLSIGIRW
jgi:hypothetical protein